MHCGLFCVVPTSVQPVSDAAALPVLTCTLFAVLALVKRTLLGVLIQSCALLVHASICMHGRLMAGSSSS